MKQIRMVDLKGQYDHIREEINEAIQGVLDSTAFINGPAVSEFQRNLESYLGTKHVIPCANGTDALQVSMMALGLKPGDEVITTSFTFIATAEVIALLGLTPVLVDVDPHTFNIDPEAIKKAITARTRAIVPVHLFGQCAEMETILDLARAHNLYIIEDTCQAIGADYNFNDGTEKKAGTIGDTGCLSFFPSKNLGAYGDGGAVFTDNDDLAASLRAIVNHGMMKRYYHDIVGVNSRLDSIQAAILNVKLKYIDSYVKSRQKAADSYNKKFKDHPRLRIPYRYPKSTHVFHQYTLVVEEGDRDGLQKFLSEKQIPAPVYYPVPLHLQKAYKDPRYKQGDFPVTESLSKRVISLPMHTELDEEQINFISGAVIEYMERD
jgi:dTDP-4-amino-4,6-dideoxygalactose transaminase